MAEESNQEKKADCTDVQPVPWYHTDLIIRKISAFLGPSDLCSFRLVSKKWKDESSSIWEYYRMHHTLNRFSEFGLKSAGALNNAVYDTLKFRKLQLPELTVFKKYRPRFKDCDFDCVGAEGLRDFFSLAKKDDAPLKDTSFRVIKLRKWNRFGNFPSGEQEGARWFITEVADKVMQLTLEICNLSMSRGEFFSTFCRMTQLKKLTIRGTYFQLRPSFPVEPTLAEILPLRNLKSLEMNYEKCTASNMPNYYFPWNLILRAMPNMKILVLSYSTWSDLYFADDQFSKLMGVLKEVKPEEKMTDLTAVIFKCIAKPNDPPIPKKDVLMMVFGSMVKLDIKVQTFRLDESECVLPVRPNLFEIDFMDALVGSIKVFIKFEDREGKNMKNPDAEENRQEKTKDWVEPVRYDYDHARTSKALLRASLMSSNFVSVALGTAVNKSMSSKLKPGELFTVFQDFRPTQDCDFNCVGAEELQNFFLGAKKDDHATTQLMDTTYVSLAFLNLRNWNYFGNFPSGHQGAKWFLNEISDKVMYLTLDECNLSMSQGEFFPTLCKLTHLKHLTIRGTYFQLRLPVEPTMDEISPIPYLLNVEMNYEKCTTKDMPNYYFPWNLLLRALPKLYSLEFSYSNRNNLDFAVQQFFKMMTEVKKFKRGELKTDYYLISFNHLAGPHADPSILKNDVMKMVSGVMNKLCVPVKKIERHQFNRLYPEMKSIELDMMAHVQNFPILLRFRKSES